MSLKDVWQNKTDGIDDVLAEDINNIAQAVIDAEKNKVDKMAGKGLSTNDYTTKEKEKLASIETGAEVNKVTSVNGKTGDVVLEIGETSQAALDEKADILVLTSEANKDFAITDSVERNIVGANIYGECTQKEFGEKIWITTDWGSVDGLVPIAPIPAGTYTVSFTIDEATPTTEGYLLLDTVDGSITVPFENSNGYTFTATGDIGAIYVSYTGSEYDNVQLNNIQIKSEAPGPTPEVPVDVECVKDPTITITDSNGENPQTVTLEDITLRGLKDNKGLWYDRDEIVVDVNKGTVTLRQSILEQSVSSAWKFNNYGTTATYRHPIPIRREQYNYSNATITGLLCNYTQITIPGMADRAIGFANAYPQNTNLSYRYEYFGVSNYDEFIAFLKQCEDNGKPLTWYAARATPIETDYTDTEWGQALLNLCTSYPTTSVLCDADCSITYKADTTNAVDNVKNELDTLKQAIISLGGTI